MAHDETTLDLTALERMVLEAALSGLSGGADSGGADNRNTAGLRAQVDAARATVRTPSGVGFVTKLQIPEALSISDPQHRNALPVVIGEHPDLPSGAEFVLQVKDGRINTIEAFCYEGMWPSDESLFSVDIGNNKERQ